MHVDYYDFLERMAKFTQVNYLLRRPVRVVVAIEYLSNFRAVDLLYKWMQCFEFFMEK
jgi:hypothetical protein